MQATCHCLTCRKLTGSTNTTNICVPAGSYHVTSGTPKAYDWTHESGMKMQISFGGNCGANISMTGDLEAFQDLVIIRAGTIDDQNALEKAAPAAELYVKNLVLWIPAPAAAGQMQ